MEFAIIKTGGKQYKVEVGKAYKVERLNGKKIEFKDLLSSRKVLATVLENKKSPKVRIVKHQPKKRHRLNRGHRQILSVIKIDKIG